MSQKGEQFYLSTSIDYTDEARERGFDMEQLLWREFFWTKVMNGGMCFYMGVSKNKGTQKWMVYNGKPYWNGWFGDTIIFGNTHMFELWYLLAKEQNSIFFTV